MVGGDGEDPVRLAEVDENTAVPLLPDAGVAVHERILRHGGLGDLGGEVEITIVYQV